MASSRFVDPPDDLRACSEAFHAEAMKHLDAVFEEQSYGRFPSYDLSSPTNITLQSVSKLFFFWCGIPFSIPIKAPFGSLWALLPEHVSISDTTTNIMFRSISSTHLNWICDEGCFGVHTKWTAYCRSLWVDRLASPMVSSMSL